mgnify:CR=1 FL=1
MIDRYTKPEMAAIWSEQRKCAMHCIMQMATVIYLNQSSYQSFSVSYTEPWLFDTPNLVGVSFVFSSFPF